MPDRSLHGVDRDVNGLLVPAAGRAGAGPMPVLLQVVSLAADLALGRHLVADVRSFSHGNHLMAPGARWPALGARDSMAGTWAPAPELRRPVSGTRQPAAGIGPRHQVSDSGSRCQF